MIGNQVTVELFCKSISIDACQYQNPALEIIFSVGNKQSSSGILQLCRTQNKRNFQIRQTFSLTLQKSVLILSKNKGILKIYLCLENQKKLSLGNVKVIIAQQPSGDTKSFKIENCYDKKASIQVSVGIRNKQIKQILRINSPTSQSSLSQIRDLHHLITSPRQSTDIRGRFPMNLKLDKRRSNKSTDRNKSKDKTLSEIHNSARTLRPLSMESGISKGHNENHDKSFQIYEQAIVELRKENQRLIYVLELQQQSNQQLKENMQKTVKNYQLNIKQMQQKMELLKEKVKKQQQKSKQMVLKMEAALLSANIQKINEAIDHQEIRVNVRQNIRETSEASHRSGKKFERKPVLSTGCRTPRASNKFSRIKNLNQHFLENASQKGPQIRVVQNNETITLNQQNQIQELQQSNQRLYQQLRILKSSKQSLVQKLKSKELNEEILQQENQQLRAEIATLNKKIEDNKTAFIKNEKWMQNAELGEENIILKKRYIQLQRRFNQSLRAISSFKNDALKAREELIEKDSLLKQYMNGNPGSSRVTNSSQKALKSKQKDTNQVEHRNFQLSRIADMLKSSIKEHEVLRYTLKFYKQKFHAQDKILRQLSIVKNNINRSFIALIKNFSQKSKLMHYKIELNRIIDEGFSHIVTEQK